MKLQVMKPVVLRKSILLAAIACLVGLALNLSPLYAQNRGVLDAEGRILRLINGTYGQLFPRGTAADRDSPVLALEVIVPGGSTKRLLVPGTASSDPESSETLVYEPNSRMAYILWEGLYSRLHPRLLLTGFNGKTWEDLIEIWSGPFADKGSPDMVISREVFPSREANQATQDRTIIHLTWWQDTLGNSRKYYAPVIIENGQYIGWTPVFDLAEFLPATLGTIPAAVTAGITNAVRVQKGKDNQSLVIGLLHPDTHQLVTLEVRVLPKAISDLAAHARAFVIEMGAIGQTPQALAQAVRTEIYNAASEFHAASREYMADQIADLIFTYLSNQTSIDFVELASNARAFVIEMGAKFVTSGLSDPRTFKVLDVGPNAFGEDPAHLFKVTVLSDRTAPEALGPATVYLSESGTDVLVAWDDETGDKVYYQTSLGSGWAEVAAIELKGSLNRDSVYQLLLQRMRP